MAKRGDRIFVGSEQDYLEDQAECQNCGRHVSLADAAMLPGCPFCCMTNAQWEDKQKFRKDMQEREKISDS